MDEPLYGPWKLSIHRRDDAVTGYEITCPMPDGSWFGLHFQPAAKPLVDYLMSVSPPPKPTP